MGVRHTRPSAARAWREGPRSRSPRRRAGCRRRRPCRSSRRAGRAGPRTTATRSPRSDRPRLSAARDRPRGRAQVRQAHPPQPRPPPLRALGCSQGQVHRPRLARHQPNQVAWPDRRQEPQARLLQAERTPDRPCGEPVAHEAHCVQDRPLTHRPGARYAPERIRTSDLVPPGASQPTSRADPPRLGADSRRGWATRISRPSGPPS